MVQRLDELALKGAVSVGLPFTTIISGPLGNGKAFKNCCMAGTAFGLCRALRSGTDESPICGRRSRSASYEKKKNVRFLRIGPLSVPPKSFWRSSALGSGGLFVYPLNQLLA